MRAAVLVALVAATTAQAGEGVGRVSLIGGWRLTPNDHFYAQAAANGAAKVADSPGGPQAGLIFGYAATDNVEVTIDLFAGTESLRLSDRGAIRTVTYGGAVGPRAYLEDMPFRGVTPYLGVLLGPALIYTYGSDSPALEQLTTGYHFAAGVNWRVNQTIGVVCEYRLILARGAVEGVGSVNGGGSWLSVGLTLYFPAEPKGPKPTPF